MRKLHNMLSHAIQRMRKCFQLSKTTTTISKCIPKQYLAAMGMRLLRITVGVISVINRDMEIHHPSGWYFRIVCPETPIATV